MTTTLIPITGGGHTIVDSDIAERIGARRVNLVCGYPRIWEAGRLEQVHRLVVGALPGQAVDHVNGQKLDNRRSNLRIVSHSINMLNRHATYGSSRFMGVWARKPKGWWRACLCVRGKRTYLGSFRSQVVAALMYDRAKACLVDVPVSSNFPRPVARSEVCRFIAETKGRIFTVVFSRRKDGTQRVMTCRTGVKSRSKGGSASYCPCLKGLALVWDVHKQDYRTIPVARVIAIKFAKVNYRIEGNHENMYAQTRRAA